MSESGAPYQPSQIEPKWQSYWDEQHTFRVGNPGDPGFDASLPKYYVLDMFPYTSGSGIHVGHPEGYTATDILARYKRMRGFQVLHPMGWDSFGLPAEQYAVQTNVHPRTTTEKAITRFRSQLKRFGFSYDWDRELATTDLRYYRWTQWIFLKMFNAWFDETARGRDEHGHEYVGRARPIGELEAELSQGKWRILPCGDIISADLADVTPDTRDWSEIKEHERRRVIDNQRLAYLDEVDVNWCPMLGTVLANEEVTNEGRSERGDHPVFRRPLKQWMLRITRYCERLIADIEKVDWPESIKAMQRNWVGKSVGAEVDFRVVDPPADVAPRLRIYTTRPDTLFGATYMVLAPEHPLLEGIVSPQQRDAVMQYVASARLKSELERSTETKEKTGVFTGAHALNPVNDEAIPVWVADYVMMGYGTGAIMAVPAHDLRDWDFARQFDLPIRAVVAPPPGYEPSKEEAQRRREDGEPPYPFVGEGMAINSGTFDGQSSTEFKNNITEWLQQRGVGEATVKYKLRDWLFSRQRYWGEPFPILHGSDGRIVGLDESDLPLDLPHMEDFKPQASSDPDEAPHPPLGRATGWATLTRDGITYSRELNTMPQWAGSCWYYLRYIDPNNDQQPFDPKAEAYWMPVDQYVGGAEHAVLHLLYARFWHKLLYDLGYVSTVEPFKRLYNQGLILSHAYKDQRGVVLPTDQVEQRGEEHFVHKETGEPVQQIVAKMSKSLKNVVNPDEILDEFGADTFRLYEMYMGPLDASKPWNTRDIPGLARFLSRVWRLVVDELTGKLSEAVVDDEPDAGQLRDLHKAIAKVTADIEEFKFNTAIAELITLTKTLTAAETRSRRVLKPFVLLLSPFAPHICEELWQRLGHSQTLAYESWPQHDPELARDDEIEVPVQINGKLRAKISTAADADQAALEQAATSDERIVTALAGKTVRKVIVVPGRLVNIVAN